MKSFSSGDEPLMHRDQKNLLRGNEGMEGGERGASPTRSEGDEDQWEDVNQGNQGADGMGAEEGGSPRLSMRRPSPLKDTRRLGGRGKRGFWVMKREEQLKKRLKRMQEGSESP